MFRACSLMDRISGFGPVDGGSIPPRLIEVIMKTDTKKFLTAVSILVGTAIGAGVLGIPYVAARAGFFVAIAYILVLGSVMLIVNLYLGEVSLRTKGNHQIAGYVKKYFGKPGKFFTEFAVIFGIYAAIIAYMLGMGGSISYLVFGDSSYTTLFGTLVGFGMSGFLWRGFKALKRFEKIGVSIILLLLLGIFLTFIGDVNFSNLNQINFSNIFIPFGVILFSLMSFHAVPEVRLVLRGKEYLMKKVIITSTLIAVIFYSLFALVVVGSQGSTTPQIATLALGTVFVFLGIFTMFTSYLALGNALAENFIFDDRMNQKKSWFLSSIVPIGIFLIIRSFEYFSFTKILGIGGVISGGLIGTMILLMAIKAKKSKGRVPEYEVPINWLIVGFLILVFVVGIIFELFLG